MSFEVGFAVYDGRRGVAFEARAQLHEDCLATRDWASLEELRGTRAPQWAHLAPGSEDYSAAAEHLGSILAWAAELVAQGAGLPDALKVAAERSDANASRRELEDWHEIRAAECEEPTTQP